MEAIILGNPYDIVQGEITPITIPAYEAEKAVIQLSDGYNPYLIGSGTTVDQYWYRTITGFLRPLTITDKVVIGGSSFVNTEIFRVSGKANITSFQLGTSITISSILDEDNLISDSNTAIPTQQSVKAYVDAQVGTGLHTGDNVSLLVNDVGYLISESDPIFTTSVAFSILIGDITNWNNAFSWGDHSLAGYITTETDPIFVASAVYGIVTQDITNWNLAFGWGNHALAGYLTSESDPIFVASPAYGVTSGLIINWNSAYAQAHTHNNFGLLQTLISSGDGTKALFNDGTYKTSVLSIAGDSTYVQYNLGGVLAASSTFTFNPVTSLLTSNQVIAKEYLYLGNTDVLIYKDSSGNLVFDDEINNATTLSQLIGGASIFTSPTGYTATTATVGGIPIGTLVADLNGETFLTILQMMLFPAPLSPDFVNPTESMNITLGTSANFNGLYVIKGSSSAMTIVETFNSGNGPGGKPYALVDGSATYFVNSSSFTNGNTVTFTSGIYGFKANQLFKANGTGEADPEFVVLGSGITVYAEDYTGYTPGTISGVKSYATVDPVYYGAFTAGTSDYDAVPTWTEIGIGCTKLISVKPTALSVNITTYSGSVNTHKYILIAYPDSYGLLTHIYYIEGGNNDVIGSFLNTTETYTRPDLTTVTYRIYYALNSYAGESTPRTLHYTVTF